MKYNILQFSFGDGYAGSAKMAILSSYALIEKGHRVILFVSKNSLTKKRALEKGIPIIEINTKQKPSLITEQVVKNFTQEKPDFAVAYHSQDRKVVMKLKSILKKDTISVAYRQNISLSTPFIGAFLYNKYFDFMIACSHGVARSLAKEGIKKNKIFVIHNTTEIPADLSAVGGSLIRNELGINDKIVLGMLSWFHKERKGFDILFEAFSKLDDRFVLLIIGIPESIQKEVFEYANSFGISASKLIMPGFIDNIYMYYKAMEIFLIPSRSEGFSLALLEAAASGLPIITSNIPGNDEFIVHNKNGLLFNIGDPRDLIQAILRLANDKIFADELGKNASETFNKEFTISRFGEKLKDFFDKAYLTIGIK